MKTFDDVRELGLYANDCCAEELIYDEGDTFWRCPRCQSSCLWQLESKITRESEFALSVA